MTKLCSAALITLLSLFLLYQITLPKLLLEADQTTKWHSIARQEELDIAKEVLEKPLKFLGLGSQCFAFSSEDNKYVVKICKAARYKPFSNPKKTERLQTDFLSYNLAFNLIPIQSQIIFLHLNKTKTLNTNIKVIDPLGIAHHLDADNLAFYIQKKAIPISIYLKNLPIADSVPFIKSLLALFKSSCQAGLQIRDLQPKNIGIYQNSPLWIDPGRIREKPALLIKEKQQQALRKFSASLTPFLNSFDPSYQTLIEKELELAL